MHDLVTCHNSKRTRICLECNEIPVLKLPMNSPEINFTENVWNIMKKVIGNQLPCSKERDVEAWYSVAPNFLEETIQCQGQLQILFSKLRSKEYILTLIYDVGVQVCSCVFNGKYLSMLLCFHRNAFNNYIHIQMLSDDTLI